MLGKKQLIALLLLPFVGLIVVSYVAAALIQPAPLIPGKSSFSLSRPARTVDLAWPAFGESAVGAVGYGVLATDGGEEPLPTASTIKVLTALAVLRQKPLRLDESGPTITIAQDDVDSYNKYVALDGSVVGVALGEQISEYQALQALLLPSANNMAETLARWAFGSVDAYNQYANTYARSLGMTHTTVTDPSGFLGTTVSTPSDLTRLGEAAIANPVIAQIANQSRATIPVEGTIQNVNIMLGSDGIIGLKTGNNDQNAGSFLFAAQQTVGSQHVTIVGAVMNGPDLYTTMRSSLPLIKSVSAGFDEVRIADAGTKVGSYDLPWQGSVQAITDGDLSIAAWRAAPLNATVTLRALQGTTADDVAVGTLSVKNVSGAPPFTIPVILKHTASGPNIFWRLAHPSF